MSASTTGAPDPALAARLARSCGLDLAQAAALARRCTLRDHADGDALVREGERATEVHWIVAGEAAVCRDSAEEGRLRVAALAPGAVIGEIAFLRDDAQAVYSATVVALGGATTASIDHLVLREDPALRDVHAALTRQFGRIAAERLSTTTAFTAEALGAALARERRLARHLGVVIMVMAVFVVLSNSRLHLAHALFGNALGETVFTSLFYFVLVGALGALFVWLLRGLAAPAAALGLELRDWRRQVRAGLAWSLPGLAACVALRAWLFPHEGMLSVHALGAGASLLSPIGLALLLGYAIVLCPLQELVTRAGVQAPVLNAFGARQAGVGAAVSTLVAAVTFGAMHVAYGVGAVLLTTAVGLYWGVAFVRTRSVLAITVSHVVLGLAAFYWFGLLR